MLAALIVGHVGAGVWTDAPTEARVDQKAELAVVIVDGPRVLAPAGIERVRIAGRTRTTVPLEASVHWFAVEPHGFRATPAKNGATSDFYSNVSTEPATFGRWLGYDHIDYFERPLAPTSPIITAAIDDDDQLAGLGTLRFKAEVELSDGRSASSPGAEAVDESGITGAVHRVSIRASDDFIGWLTAYLLVPEVFGSAGGGRNHQTERFDGADCADVMVGALRRTGRSLAYTNVAGLPGYTTRVAPPTELDEHGRPASPIRAVRRGDLIRIDYGGELRHHTPRDWDHVAALYEDRSDPTGPFHGGPDGQLDGFDIVIHMGHPHLVIEPLANQAPATIDVLRWR